VTVTLLAYQKVKDYLINNPAAEGGPKVSVTISWPLAISWFLNYNETMRNLQLNIQLPDMLRITEMDLKIMLAAKLYDGKGKKARRFQPAYRTYGG
jgi:hypothetical protein